MPGNYLLIVVVGSILVGGVLLTKYFLRMPAKNFFVGIPGVIIGLIVGALLSVPLQNLPGDFGLWVPITVMAISVLGSVYLFYARRDTMEGQFSHLRSLVLPAKTEEKLKSHLSLDTSVIIDGRILGVAKTGFIIGPLKVYRFVLEELQRISDSKDDLKREKGRRGLEMLTLLEKEKDIKLEIIDEDYEDIKEVDAKLLKMAKNHHDLIVTTDYNLNRIAKIQGITVLNLNELSEAIKPSLIPGETLKVKIIQTGKERAQGVAYLEDGTMIVVEKGEKFVGKQKEVIINRIIQTPAGKMYFAKMNGNDSGNRK